MTQHEPAAEDRAYGIANWVPVTQLASEIAREMDFRIVPSGNYSFLFKAIDNNDDIITAWIHSKSDQVYLEIIGYESEDPEGETVRYKDDAILLIRDIFEESQAAAVPR